MKQEQDRFTLEDNIMEVWQTSNDIRLIVEQFQEPYHPNLQNALLVKLLSSLSGLEEIHSLRCQKLMDTFELLLQTGQIINSDVDVDTIAKNVSKNYQTDLPS